MLDTRELFIRNLQIGTFPTKVSFRLTATRVPEELFWSSKITGGPGCDPLANGLTGSDVMAEGSSVTSGKRSLYGPKLSAVWWSTQPAGCAILPQRVGTRSERWTPKR